MVCYLGSHLGNVINWFRLIPRCPMRGQALYTKNHLFNNTIHSDLEVGIFICHSLLIYSGEKVEVASWRSTISLFSDFVSIIGLYGFFHLWEAVNMYSICFIFLLLPFESVF